MLNSHGEETTVSENLGKVTLLEFWASWCMPCRKENPNLVKTYKKHEPKGFKIISVSQDLDENSCQNAIEADGLPWTHLCDFGGDKSKAGLIYGISGIPDDFLLNEDGIIIARNLRGNELDEALKELF